ncbi:MAG: hypothetical protein Q9200_000112 [Gallowayella weberi]
MSAPQKPLFSIPFNEPVAFGNRSPAEGFGDGFTSSDYPGHGASQGKNGYQFRGSDPDSDEDDANGTIRRYPAPQKGSLSQELNSDDQRVGTAKYTRVLMPASTVSSQDSIDGYDSFENTNNKKKRKIPTSGGLGGHHSSLSSEMAHMGISPNRDYDSSPSDMDGGVGHYYGTGSSAVPTTSSGTGISGAGRGRYGRAAPRAPSGRSPLAVSTNGSNALQAGRQLLQKQDLTTSAGPPSAKAAKGQENVSLLKQQAAKKPASSKTQFTFTCDSDSARSMAWQEQSAATPAYHTIPASNTLPAETIHHGRDFATQGTQTSPNIQPDPNGHALPPQAAPNAETPQPPPKPRRSLAKQLALAARQRRLQQEYDNYHHPPSAEDTWVCEFCEYEMIFGRPPEALIRQYEIKDRRERRHLAEKRRLLEKAKMKGRKGKKGTKNTAKNNSTANAGGQSASKQRYDQPVDNSAQTHGRQSEEYFGEGFDDDPPPGSYSVPQTPTRIPQPIAHTQHQSVRSATGAGINGGMGSTSAKTDYRNLDNEWLHDRYDDDPEGGIGHVCRGENTDTNKLVHLPEARSTPEKIVTLQIQPCKRYLLDSPASVLIYFRSSPGAKLRVDNLHYDLTEEDLEDLFTRIGPINSLALRFDRAGRSSGTAFVTYNHLSDARLAIREFDGANAHGQPIRLTLLPTAPAGDIRGRGAVARNPFDTVERPPKSLFDRIDDPRFGSASRSRMGRSRSRSPGKPRRSDLSRPAPEGVDRYVPPSAGGRSRVRSRSPRRRREDVGGRGRGRGGERRGGGRENAGARPRKTQDELDKEMEDYWGPTGQPDGGAAAAASGTQNGVASVAAPVVVGGDEDIDMGIE